MDDVGDRGVEAIDVYDEAASMVIKLRKTEIGMTFDELSAASGINLQTVKRLVNGHRRISMGNFVELSKALGVDPADVMRAIIARVKTAI